MTDKSQITRRTALASLGAVGLAAVGPRVVRGLRGEPPFTRYTFAQSAGPDLRIVWYELYNGEYQEDSNRFTSGPPLSNTSESFNDSAKAGRFVDTTADAEGKAVNAGPVISLSNVLPGDEGVLVIGLLAEDADARVWFRVSLDETAENGLYEPERVDGDTTETDGELQDALDVRLWYDNGMFGGCNGQLDASEAFVTGLSTLGDADGRLAAVADGTEDGLVLDFGPLDSGCLPTGVERCVSFAWAIDPAVDNTAQTDSVAFDVEFATVACDDDTNPFAAGSDGDASTTGVDTAGGGA